ncbi:MAG: hypothetical protein IT373_11705 [Polyangiaceae bacterium]|nr:hypothetical protein [Polyangiaceae bacterium]
MAFPLLFADVAPPKLPVPTGSAAIVFSGILVGLAGLVCFFAWLVVRKRRPKLGRALGLGAIACTLGYAAAVVASWYVRPPRPLPPPRPAPAASAPAAPDTSAATTASAASSGAP